MQAERLLLTCRHVFHLVLAHPTRFVCETCPPSCSLSAFAGWIKTSSASSWVCLASADTCRWVEVRMNIRRTTTAGKCDQGVANASQIRRLSRPYFQSSRGANLQKRGWFSFHACSRLVVLILHRKPYNYASANWKELLGVIWVTCVL